MDNPICHVHQVEMSFKGGNPMMDDYSCDVAGCKCYKMVEKMDIMSCLQGVFDEKLPERKSGRGWNL